MLGGRMILDGVGYSVHDIMVQEQDQNGKPTGKSLPVKALLIQDGHSQLQFEWRMTAEQMETLADELMGRKVHIAGPGEMARLNGGQDT